MSEKCQGSLEHRLKTTAVTDRNVNANVLQSIPVKIHAALVRQVFLGGVDNQATEDT